MLKYPRPSSGIQSRKSDNCLPSPQREGTIIKRAPVPNPDVSNDPEAAREYDTSTAKRGKRLGKTFIKALSKLGFEKGRILDVSTGAGEVAIELAQAFPEAQVVGLVLSEPLLEMARASTAEAGLSDRLSFEKGDVQAMPFEDNSFDAVVSLNTLHVVDRPVAMLDEIDRVLTPDGILAVSDIKRSWLGVFISLLRTAYTSAEAKELLRRSRLRPWEFRESFRSFSFGAGKSVDSLLKG